MPKKSPNFWQLLAKKMSPKASEYHQNCDKSPHLVTLFLLHQRDLNFTSDINLVGGYCLQQIFLLNCIHFILSSENGPVLNRNCQVEYWVLKRPVLRCFQYSGLRFSDSYCDKKLTLICSGLIFVRLTFASNKNHDKLF